MPKTHPIILAHGFARFDILGGFHFTFNNNLPDDIFHYFRKIRTVLRNNGFSSYYSNVSWAARLEQRAKELEREVERIILETKAQRVHIIAHSMGGLDARLMLYNNRNNPDFIFKIASLVTLGTPHEGSPIADLFLKGTDPFIDPFKIFFGFDFSGLRDLTTDACARLNEKTREWENSPACTVYFRSYAGEQKFKNIIPPLAGPALLILRKEGANDGVVSVSSAKWQDKYFAGTINADHINLIGWWDIREPLTKIEFETYIQQKYVDIATELANKFPLSSL